MEVDPKLQQYLSRFKRLEDFRVDVSAGFINTRGTAARAAGVWVVFLV